jgi:Uncharacterized iron-regulated membrane protein
MTVKRGLIFLHRWLGLITGIVVLIVCITGSLYVFKDEIENVTQSYRFVKPQQLPVKSPGEIKDIAEKNLPGKSIRGVDYKGNDHSLCVSFYDYNPQYYYLMYINPYTGKVMKIKDMSRDFFRLIIEGHCYLWLPPAIGAPIVAISTLVFIFLFLSGLFIWFPRKIKRSRFLMKWKAGWKRRIYDLHTIVGFYFSLILLIVAMTGLVWGFQWFGNGLYWITSGGKQIEERVQIASVPPTVISKTVTSLDSLFNKVCKEYPDSEIISLSYPADKESTIQISVNNNAGTYWKTDYYYFDQYSFKEIKTTNGIRGKLSDASGADKLRRMNYDIHTGAIGGIWGKILVFIAALFAASLPVTGFILWWRKR